MLNKFITLSICIITLNSCSFSSQKTKDKLEGKYILIEGKSIYNSFSFKGQSTIVIESFGMEFVTSYVKDEDYLRIEAEPSHLLLKIQSKDTIVGEGFASGIYIKESLWKKSQAAKTSDIKQDTIASVPNTKACRAFDVDCITICLFSYQRDIHTASFYIYIIKKFNKST